MSEKKGFDCDWKRTQLSQLLIFAIKEHTFYCVDRAKNAVESLHACSPISRTWSKQLTTDPTLPSLPPITEKPNNIDPTTYHLKLRETYQNSGDATSPKVIHSGVYSYWR